MELQKLKEIANKYNNLPVGKDIIDEEFSFVEEMTSRPSMCIIPDYEDIIDYIFTLWSLGVKIPKELTFGEPYDYILRNSTFHDDAWYFKNSPGIHNSDTYNIFKNAKYIRSYMWAYIVNMTYSDFQEINNKKDTLFPLTRKMLESPREVLKTASELDLVYYMIDLYNWIYVAGFNTFIEFVSF